MNTLYFLVVMLAPAAMLAVGILWRVSPPPYRSKGLAYSTELTQSNPDAWDMAHRNCAKLWTRIGIVSGVVCVILIVLFQEVLENLWMWFVVGQMVLFCVSVFMVDLLLKTIYSDENQNKNK